LALYGDGLYGNNLYGSSSSVTHSDYLKYISTVTNRVEAIKVELLYPNLETQNEITSFASMSDGQLTINFTNGVRRAISLTLINPNLRFKFDPSSLWINSMFRCYRGYLIKNSWYWILLGTFVISDSSMNSNISNTTISLSGLDRFSMLDGQLAGYLSAIYQADVGSDMISVVDAILNEVENNSSLLYDSIFTGYSLPYTLRKEYGSTYFDILKDLANLRSSNIYYNMNGQMCFQSGIEDIDDSIKPVTYSFYKNNSKYDVNYITGKSNFNISKVRNSVTVIGDNINGEIFDATVKNENLLSPTRIQLIGERALPPIQDNVINTDQLALDRANYELKKCLLLGTTVEITALCLPHLDVNTVIELTDTDLNFDHTRLLIQSINMPLTIGGVMTLSCSNVNELPFTNI
jgi:hypothetical protein